VILCPPGTVGGVDQRGGAPGTRETDLLRPMHLVQHVNALLLAGGSAYGLAAADGVMHWLEDRGIGYQAGEFVVPIVPAAIIFDLSVGQPGIRPTAAMGRAACDSASDTAVTQGCVGAGTGARVGGMLGNAFATKGGLGSHALHFDNGLIVAALAVVNAAGDVLDERGSILGGVRSAPDSHEFPGMLNMLRAQTEVAVPAANTVIGVVATNARLTKEQANKVAQMAHDGLARAVNPAHTLFDGDTIFTLATGTVEADMSLVGAFGAEAFAAAIRSAVRSAVTLGGVRAYND
jgi:L-aminopeptidase/D-esterase-like protein